MLVCGNLPGQLLQVTPISQVLEPVPPGTLLNVRKVTNCFGWEQIGNRMGAQWVSVGIN